MVALLIPKLYIISEENDCYTLYAVSCQALIRYNMKPPGECLTAVHKSNEGDCVTDISMSML